MKTLTLPTLQEKLQELVSRQEYGFHWDTYNGWSYETKQGLAYEPDGSFWFASELPTQYPSFASPGWVVKNNRRDKGAFCVIAPHQNI